MPTITSSQRRSLLLLLLLLHQPHFLSSLRSLLTHLLTKVFPFSFGTRSSPVFHLPSATAAASTLIFLAGFPVINISPAIWQHQLPAARLRLRSRGSHIAQVNVAKIRSPVNLVEGLLLHPRVLVTSFTESFAAPVDHHETFVTTSPPPPLPLLHNGFCAM